MAGPTVQKFTSIPANSSALVDMGQYDRIGGTGATVDVYAASLTGNAGDINMSLFLGSDTVCNKADLVVRAGGPAVNENHVVHGVGLGGDKIAVELTNTTAGAIIVGTLIVVNNA